MALQRPLKRTTIVTRYEAAYAQLYGGYRIETRSGPKLLAPHNFNGKNASYFYSYASKTLNPPSNELVNKVVRSLKKSGKDAPMERLRVRGAVLGVYKLKDCSYEEAKLAAGTDVHVEEGMSQYLLIEQKWSLDEPYQVSIPKNEDGNYKRIDRRFPLGAGDEQRIWGLLEVKCKRDSERERKRDSRE